MRKTCFQFLNQIGFECAMLPDLTQTSFSDLALRAQYQTGWCYYRMGRDMEAADSFGAFLKKYPDSKFSQDASSQCASILLSAAQNFEKWKMPDDAARVYKRLEELKQK